SEDWDILVVLKMDRIHRNSVNFTLMMNDLRNNGKEFNSMQEKFDTTTAMGRFVMDIMQRIAQLESEQIGERVKVGMTQKAHFGTGPMGSGHPYGYVYSKGNLEVIEDEAYTVSAIYRLYNEGSSMEDIANSLNRSNIPAKKGGQWNRQSICNILHNPIYLGYIEWDGIIRRGEHNAIVERKSYEAVNGPLNV
ncbi:MAG TPA: recombinase family protein, partial [Candidatus Methanomethylophilaceae archaeon]|nr:recombinase family protein [Candidatus Methanomethylophilaceae archaeon]